MFFFFDYSHFEVKIGASPKEADIAIVSVDSIGTVGYLNQYVLKEYSLSLDILKKLNLTKGFDFYNSKEKPILFVVTVGNGDTENSLKANLYNALKVNLKRLSNKTVWIPLMGSGSGGLSISESYEITKSVLDEFREYINESKCKIIVSIPDDKKGQKLYNEIEGKIKYSNRPSDFDTSLAINSLKKVSDLLNYLNVTYYFVGHDWEGQLQKERFFKENIWETVYEDRFTGLIKNISLNDLLILKTPIDKYNVGHLKIEAIGKVTESSKNGTSVKVDWIIKNLNFSTRDLGYNKATITAAQKDSIIDIFSKLTSKDFQKLIDIYSNKRSEKIESILNDPVTKKHKVNTTLPGLLRDTDDGEDYLDIKEDVNAFARVIAAKSFEPPLAIALLGKWGSGKSFFMRKLKEGIQRLSKDNPQKAFCESIAHVHFNAWSYMDSNLWASIITRIFEGLDDYIKNSGATEKEKKDLEKELFQKLTISKEELKELNAQKGKVEKKIIALEAKKKTAESELKDKIKSIRNSTLKAIFNTVDKEFKVQEQIKKTLNENPTFVDSAEKFEKIVPQKYWDNPVEFYKQLKSGYTFIKAFLHRNKWKTNLFWAIAIVVIILATPVITFIVNLLLSWQDFTFTDKDWVVISLYGAIFTRAVDTYLKLRKQMAPFWAIKEDYEAKKENALFVFEQEQKALAIEIEKDKEDIIQLKEQIILNKDLQANIEFKLKSALSTEALYTFIEKRANSDDYKKHLGIISLIRKDFEILSGLLTGHKTELVSNEDSDKFKKMFPNKRPLERIILYIDDLDRCPEERVVEVLEAVNLLMAFPLFVVVVGVDPRWVKNALIKKHHMQFTGQIGKNENKEIELIEASSYLEKIFQVPFHLKDASDDSIKNMIEKFANTKIQLIEEILVQGKAEKEVIENTGKLKADNEKITADQDIVSKESTSTNNDSKTIGIDEEKISALDISQEEIDEIKKLTGIIGTNPRAVKRFINIYRIVKTHEEFNYTSNKDLISIMFLLALSIGIYKKRMQDFEDFIMIPQYSSYTFANYKVNFAELYKEVEKNKAVMELTSKNFKEHYQFIKRFTFKNI